MKLNCWPRMFKKKATKTMWVSTAKQRPNGMLKFQKKSKTIR